MASACGIRLRIGSEADAILKRKMALEIAPGCPEELRSNQKCLSGTPGASWSVLAASGSCPGDFRGTPEATQKPPSTAQGVPESASGIPKDAAEAPWAAADWLFLVAVGPLNLSTALLQKSLFYVIKIKVLQGRAPQNRR